MRRPPAHHHQKNRQDRPVQARPAAFAARLCERAALRGAVALILLFALFPVYWAVVTSLKRGPALLRMEFFPARPSLENYVTVFAEQDFGANILNSLLVATSTVAVALAVAVPAAYALGRVRFRGRMTLLYTVLGVSMFPQVAVLAGMFEAIRALGLYNHWAALTFSYTLFTLPFTVWVLTAFMAGLPAELEEAARVDGASTFTVIVRVFLPLLAPGLVTCGLLAFIAAWNEFLFALTFTLTNDARTVPVAIALITGAGQYELPWGNIMAASVIVTLPLILLVLFFQQRIVAGLALGAVKG